MFETPAIIVEAIKQVGIEAVAGGKFTGGTTRVGKCPLCQSKSRRFTIREGSRWFCHSCEVGGDVVALEAMLAGVPMVEAARRLLGGAWRARVDTPVADARQRALSESAEAEAARKAGYAAEIWRCGGVFAGSLAETYMAGRGIVPEVLAAMAPNLRFNPRARWFWDHLERRWVTAPAMVALVVVAGPDRRPVATGGVHGTYLAADGSGKALDTRPIPPEERANSKMMWGPQGLDGRPGGTWLIGPTPAWLDGVSGSVGAEGIESAASLASLAFLKTGVVPRAWAALSLDRLAGRLLKDAEKCVDLKGLTAQPDTAFTWPGLEDVEIGVDRDMKPLDFDSRTARGKPCKVRLSGEARTLISARMAVAAWKTAGTKRVWAIAPPPRSDFNDELRRVLAARAQAAADRVGGDSVTKVGGV